MMSKNRSVIYIKSIGSKLIAIWIASVILHACSDSNNNASKPATPPQDQKGTALIVTDFAGNKIELVAPAKKIVALAPHIVENAFTAGAGENLVGVVEYSNYPDEAKHLPLVGGYSNTNIEKIIELNPDLVIAWKSGNSNNSVTRIKELGYPVYIDQPDTLADIAKSIKDIGILAGTSQIADIAAEDYISKVKTIRQRALNKKPVTTFYQVWNSPLQTINGQHFISAAIEVCGGINIYASESVIAPVINIESILERNPETIIASGMSSAKPEWLDDWLKWPSLNAVQKNNLFFVDPDHIQRHTVRLLLGIETVCSQLDIARQRMEN